MSFYLSVPGPMSNDEATELAMTYFFLSAEHRITDAEYTLFEKIGEELTGFADAKGTIIGECEKVLNQGYTGSSSVFSALPRSLGIASGAGMFSIQDDASKSGETKNTVSRFDTVSKVLKECVKDFKQPHKYRTLWRFIDLMYQTSSETHRSLTELWAQEGQIDASVFDEMRDTFHTFQALEDRKQWLSDNRKNLDGADAIKAEIDKNWNDTAESISALINIG